MLNRFDSRSWIACSAVVLLMTASGALAGETAIHEFTASGIDGSTPYAGLVRDGAGDLYGTTRLGGNRSGLCTDGGCGTVFELIPPAPGKRAWVRKTLHVFVGSDGAAPVAGLIFDGSGNLYGTTNSGGLFSDGVVFELSPPAPGKTLWKETILHNFGQNSVGGQGPEAPVIFDAAGNLYGTTRGGGRRKESGVGTVFELSPPAPGKTAWKETVLLKFSRVDGAHPTAGLVRDPSGNLFGTTPDGGAFCLSCGTVFELSPPTIGHPAWTETVLHNFADTDGAGPLGDLVLDSVGNLYGTTYRGKGATVGGIVYELSPPSTGQTAWNFTILYAFDTNPNDGYNPSASLLMDGSGNLFGTTLRTTSAVCANQIYCGGTVFELSPPAAGHTAWTEAVLHTFTGTPDGANPPSPVVLDGSGNIYGTTEFGGTGTNCTGGCGTVFEITP
jgi:uncharacterized repeat protein (TIGR03803 family)